MTGALARSAVEAGRAATGRAVAARVVRGQLRGTLGWAALFAIVVYTSAYGYATAYGTAAERASLQQSLGGNVGLAALFGRPDTLATLGGFTAWRSLGVLMIVGIVWGIFLGARVLRGEEETGRWELVLSGVINQRRATQAVVGAVLVILAMVFGFSALATLGSSHFAVGRYGAGEALLLAADLTGPAALSASLAMVACQVAPTRRRAATTAGAVLALLFVVRMLVAVYPAQSWLRRVDPLCWFDETAPLTRNRVGWLGAAYLLCGVLAALAILLSSRRDSGAALWQPAHTHERRRRRVGGPLALTARASAGAAAGWLVAVSSLGLVVGILSGPVADAAAKSTGMQDIFAHLLGARRHGAEAFLGLTMLVLVTVVSLCGVALVAALREEESSGRLQVLLAAPVARSAWLLGRVGALCFAMIVGGVAIAIATLAGTSASRSGIAAPTLFAAGLNAVPVPLVTGAGAIAVFGWRPRWAAGVGYAIVASGFVIQFIGSLVRAPWWLLDLSLLHHLTPAPAEPIRVGTDLVLVAIAVVLFAAGVLLFARRDIDEG